MYLCSKIKLARAEDVKRAAFKIQMLKCENFNGIGCYQSIRTNDSKRTHVRITIAQTPRNHQMMGLASPIDTPSHFLLSVKQRSRSKWPLLYLPRNMPRNSQSPRHSSTVLRLIKLCFWQRSRTRYHCRQGLFHSWNTLEWRASGWNVDTLDKIPRMRYILS